MAPSTPRPAASTAALVFDKTFDPQTGRPVDILPGLVRITAGNGGPFTFTGTNSFLAGHQRLAVIDPGPDDDRHLGALLSAIGDRPVDAIILTHTHRDHCGLVEKFRRERPAPLWFAGPHRLSRPAHGFEARFLRRAADWTLVPERLLGDGERVDLDGIALDVLATPGHCANHLSFGITGTDTVLSGDHVMGWSSTLVSVPDGSMADYLASLDRIIAAPYRRYVPSHGGPIADGRAYAEALKAHRLNRNGQILEAVRHGARTIGALLRAVYPGLSPKLVPAARMTLIAHIEFLADQGALAAERGLLGWRLTPG